MEECCWKSTTRNTATKGITVWDNVSVKKKLPTGWAVLVVKCYTKYEYVPKFLDLAISTLL